MRDCEEVVRLDGLTEMEVSSRHDLLQVHRRGSALRHTGKSTSTLHHLVKLLNCITSFWSFTNFNKLCPFDLSQVSQRGNFQAGPTQCSTLWSLTQWPSLLVGFKLMFFL